MFRVWLAGFRIRHDTCEAKLEHMMLNALPVDLAALLSQVVCHLPAAFEWMAGESCSISFMQFQFFRIETMNFRLQIVRRVIRTGHFALVSQRYRMLSSKPSLHTFSGYSELFKPFEFHAHSNYL
jgi:hypothetical protein